MHDLSLIQKNDNIILSKDNKVYTQLMAVASLFKEDAYKPLLPSGSTSGKYTKC